MAETIWLWVGFNAAVLLMLALDLGVTGDRFSKRCR